MKKLKREKRGAATGERGTVKSGRSWRSLDWPLVGMIVAIKMLVLLFGVEAYSVLQNQSAGAFRGWLEIWNRWDAPHYLDLAREGYVAAGDERFWIVFYPLYPWTVRLCAFVSGDYLASAFIVSALASIAAGLLLQRLVRLDCDEEVARGAVWFMFIFPTSYFLHIGYTESLFLALTLGAFLAARQGRWWLAGTIGALASLTRINGSLLIPALAVEAFGVYRRERRWRWEWLWIAFVGCGFALYLLLNWKVLGDPLAFLRIQRGHWYRELTAPWVGIGATWESVMTRAPAEALMVGWQEFFFVMLGLASTIWCWLKLRPSYAVWMTLNWLLWTSTSFVLSTPRYTLILFPIYVLFAQLSDARVIWRSLLTVWSLMMLALFASLFVQGQWAF